MEEFFLFFKQTLQSSAFVRSSRNNSLRNLSVWYLPPTGKMVHSSGSLASGEAQRGQHGVQDTGMSLQLVWEPHVSHMVAVRAWV